MGWFRSEMHHEVPAFVLSQGQASFGRLARMSPVLEHLPRTHPGAVMKIPPKQGPRGFGPFCDLQSWNEPSLFCTSSGLLFVLLSTEDYL